MRNSKVRVLLYEFYLTRTISSIIKQEDFLYILLYIYVVPVKCLYKVTPQRMAFCHCQLFECFAQVVYCFCDLWNGHDTPDERAITKLPHKKGIH